MPFDIDVTEKKPETTLADVADAIDCIAKVIADGNAKGLGRQWRSLTSAEHVARALRHVLEWQHGRDPEDLSHATTRLALALQLDLETRRGPMPGPLGLLGLHGEAEADVAGDKTHKIVGGSPADATVDRVHHCGPPRSARSPVSFHPTNERNEP